MRWIPLSLIILLLPTFSYSADWPTWRGTLRDGKSEETGLLKEWPEQGPDVSWKATGIGTGYASVSVANGRVFTMGRRNGMEYLLALSESTGELIWESEVGPGSKENGPNCTPTVDGDRVYGLSFEGELVCVDVNSGREIWRVNFPRQYGGKMMSMWGYSESVLIDGDRLICTPGSPRAVMAALDKVTGKTLWTTELPATGQYGTDGAGYSSIVISQAAGVKQYVQLIGRGVIGVAASDGKFLWGYGKIANKTANVPTPIVDGNFVFASTGYNDGGSALLELTGNRNRISAREVYYKSSKELQNHHGGMILVGNYVYFGQGHNNGFPACVNVRTGQNQWGRQRGAGTGSAAVAYADGHLYFRYQNGVVALIKADPEQYQLVSQFDENSLFGSGVRWAHPVIANGHLFLRANNEMVCLNLRAD